MLFSCGGVLRLATLVGIIFGAGSVFLGRPRPRFTGWLNVSACGGIPNVMGSVLFGSVILSLWVFGGISGALAVYGFNLLT